MDRNHTKELLDTMLHPVRMRVLMALAGSQGMTPLQMSEQLSDVPQATLYRHINRLAGAGLLRLVEERPVRGTLEKVYALDQAGQSHLDGEAMAQLTKEDHLRYFTAFAVSLLDQFSRYLSHHPAVDLAADGAGYTQVPLFMTDNELVEFSQAINQALLPYLEPAGTQPGGQERKKRLFATIMMPVVSGE